MSGTKQPTFRSAANKLIVVCLVGGFVFLVGGAVVFFRRKTDSPLEQPALKNKTTGMRFSSEPIVIAQPTRPIPVKDTDGGLTGQDSDRTPEMRGDSQKKQSGRAGTIDAAQVNGFINARFAQVRACYERRLKNNPMLEGKLDLNIDITIQGQVKSVTVNQDTIRDSEMLKCVTQTITKWSFPKPTGGGVVVGKTFNFKKRA